MPTYRITGVYATARSLGLVDAQTPEDAIAVALARGQAVEGIPLCEECSERTDGHLVLVDYAAELIEE